MIRLSSIPSFCCSAASVTLVTCLTACSGTSGTSATPTAPSTATQTVPAAPISFRFTNINIADRSVSMDWNAVSGAERYIIEAGSESGASDLGTVQVNAPATTATLSGIPPSDAIHLSIKSANSAGVSARGPERRIELPDMRDIIEALFFGSGRFAFDGRIVVPRTPAARMRGWAPGSRVSVRVPHAVGGDQLNAIVQTVNDFNAALAGAITFFVEQATLTAAQYEQLRPAGITIIVGDSTCRRADGSSADCSLSTPAPVFSTSQIRMGTLTELRSVWAHELGHSLGLSHLLLRVAITSPLTYTNLFVEHKPAMGSIIVANAEDTEGYSPTEVRLFSGLELEAIRRVYASGLRPGSTLAEFISRNLIKP